MFLSVEFPFRWTLPFSLKSKNLTRVKNSRYKKKTGKLAKCIKIKIKVDKSRYKIFDQTIVMAAYLPAGQESVLSRLMT